MKTKESNLIGLVILDILKEREHMALKLMLETEENYQLFLLKLLNILIGKDSTIPLSNFLDLHNMSGKEINLNNHTNDIIEDIAELAFKGYSSENTIWLKENKNIVYLEHLSFLEDVRSEIEKKERITIKNRLKLLSEMRDFDLTEDEMREGIILYERTRLRKHFAQLSAQEKTVTKVKASNSPNRLKYASILLLIGVSSIILAYSIPQVRNFIKKEFKELFQKEEQAKPLPNKLNTNTEAILPPDTAIIQIDSTGADSIFIKTESQNKKETEAVKAKANYKENVITEVVVVPKKEVPLIAHIENREASISDYQNYFARNKKQLDPIESLWKINGAISKYPDNPVILTCAIRKLEGKNYELVYFTLDGSIAKMHYKSLITSKGDFSNFQLTQYENDSLCNPYGIFLSEKNILTFKSHFILGDFANVSSEMKSEKVDCTITAKKIK